MKLLKYLLLFILFIILIVGGSFFYAFKIEPYTLKVTQHDLNNNEPNTQLIKIVQFSDVHIKEDFTYHNLTKVVDKINQQKADIVVFTGDLYDNYAEYNDDENIIEELKKINATYEKIAIWGNRDYGGGAQNHYEFIMNQAGFTLLKNENMNVSIMEDKKIMFTGLDDSMLGNVSMPNNIKTGNSNYNILLTHEPDIIDDFPDADYNLILSGHSHGGQIDIPFLPIVNEKAIAVTAYSTKYVSGMYTLTPDKKLYVNTGIGTTHISARFGVVPEISIFYIYL